MQDDANGHGITTERPFPIDIGSDVFREAATPQLMMEWARRRPFPAKRGGMDVTVFAGLDDVKAAFFDAERFTVVAPKVDGMDAFDQFGGLESVLQMAGDRHMRVRKLLNPAFAPRSIMALSETVDRIVDAKLDRIARIGPAFDIMDDYAADLIRRILLRATLQLTEEQQEVFERMHQALSLVADFRPGEPWPDAFQRCVVEVRDVIQEIVDARRGRAGDDFISRLVNTEIDGDRLSDDEIFGQINAICAGALGSTAGSIGMAVWLLCRNPDQLALLKEDMDRRIGGAIEESLRSRGTGVFAFVRFATQDTEQNGTFIAQGTPVLIAMHAANHDERYFDDPLKFDILRNNRLLQSFGGGIHTCIGMRLAKLVMRSAIIRLFTRFPDCRLAQADAVPKFGGLPGELYPLSIPAIAW